MEWKEQESGFAQASGAWDFKQDPVIEGEIISIYHFRSKFNPTKMQLGVKMLVYFKNRPGDKRNNEVYSFVPGTSLEDRMQKYHTRENSGIGDFVRIEFIGMKENKSGTSQYKEYRVMLVNGYREQGGLDAYAQTNVSFPGTQAPMPQAPMPQAPMPQAPMPQIPQAPMPQIPQAPMPQIPQAPMPQAPMPQAPMPQAPMPQALPDIPIPNPGNIETDAIPARIAINGIEKSVFQWKNDSRYFLGSTPDMSRFFWTTNQNSFYNE